ncbi:MerR family transcriptional regulator [Micromonospora sp. BRA006-A]|nr:MerR family transcriptional regulator [Micromonospora sp. BRA006-A]
MDDAERYSIGDLARRTGLPVKTIRFWSDCGVVPPTGRGPAGHRRYDAAAVARLDLVRTLRELGVDLPTVRRVVAREVTLGEVASAHADALTAQIRLLRTRRAVLTVIARRGRRVRGRPAAPAGGPGLAGTTAAGRRVPRRGVRRPDRSGVRRHPPVAHAGAARRSGRLPDRGVGGAGRAGTGPGFRPGCAGWPSSTRRTGTAPRAYAGTWSPWSGRRWPSRSPTASSRPRRAPIRSWPGRRAGTRGSAAGRTTPACAGGCWTGCGARAILAGSGTWSCSP